MQTSVRNAPVVDVCVGSASVRRSVQESLRRSDSSNSRSSTCVRSATASLTSCLCSAEERISVPAGTVNPPNNTCLFPGTTVSEAGPTNVVHQRDVETDVRRPSTAGPTRGGGDPSRNRRASTFGGVSISDGTENRRGGLVVVLRVMITFVNRMRRWMSRHSARRCQGLPLPHAVADVRRFLDALYYEEICFLVLRSCLTVMHTGILLYSCILEEPFQVHVPVAPLLAVLAGLTLLRVVCQFQIVRALSRLRWAWWQRAVLADFVKLLRSPLWQCQRLLFVVSFSFYFVALHIAYYRGPTSELEVSRAPVLMRYVSLVVLTFLSVLGPHILMLVIVCTSLIVCWCASTAEIEQILVEEPRGAGRALPSRLLQMIHEEQWMPPGRNCSRSSNMYNGVSSSSNSRSSSRSKCGSDNNNNTTHVSNKQLQEYQQEEGRRNKSSSTRTREYCIDEDERNARRNSSCCDSRPQETRKPDGTDRERVTSDSTCAICLTEFYEGDVVRRLPCSHVFHSACITRWLSSHASCPLRCYVNFFSVYMSQPPYNANRHLRVLGFQLLRRPRCRLLESFRRQRHERHVVRGQHGGRQQVDVQRQEQEQQQEQPQEQQEEQQQELQQQGGDDCQQNQDQQCCTMNEEEEKQEGVVQRSDQIRQARSPLGTGAADRVAEIRLPVDQVHDRNDASAAAGAAATELQAYIISPRLQCLSGATVKRMPSQGPEDIIEVEDLAAEVLLEGVANTVLLPCSTNEANKEDHDTCFVPVKVSDHHLQEESGRLDANEEGLTLFLQKQNSDVYYTAGAASAGHAVSASLESTVARSTSSGDGSSGCLASQCDQGKYSPEEDD